MNAHRDPDRLINAFLMEGQTELADPVYDAVRATIEQKRQRVVFGPWRLPDIMNKFVPLGLGAAAVVLVLVVGTQLLRTPASDGGVGGAPSTTPSATPSPTAEPSVAGPSASADPGLPVGSSFVLIDRDGVRGTVTVPAPGWGGDGGIMAKNDSVDPPDGVGMITFTGELYVFGDPCEWSKTKPETPARTVDELVAALTAQASRDASAPVDITVGGHAGKSITLHVPNDAIFSQCDEGKFGSWNDGVEPGPSRYHQGPGQIDELWILDVDGVLTVIDTAYYAGTPVENVEEMRAIVESATFE
jgi:hypothetical protein